MATYLGFFFGEREAQMDGWTLKRLVLQDEEMKKDRLELRSLIQAQNDEIVRLKKRVGIK